MKREKESVGSFLDVDTTEDPPCKFGTSSNDGSFSRSSLAQRHSTYITVEEATCVFLSV